MPVKRVTDKYLEGPDMIVEMTVSGMSSSLGIKSSSRARAIAAAGLNVPKSLSDRQRITKIENMNVKFSGPLSGSGLGIASGNVVVRVRDAI